MVDLELIDRAPPGEEIDHLTFVPFFPDGMCAVIRTSDANFVLPSGETKPGEDYLLDAALRIPLETAGFRRQTFHAFAQRGRHLYAWCEGARYHGDRPHAEVPLEIRDPDDMANVLRAAGAGDVAEIVEAATRSYRAIDAETHHAEHEEILERAYLRADTVEGGSGYGGTPEEWRVAREPITDGIEHDGTFLDVGCANGLLMESVSEWCAERGLTVEPYGIDIGAGLVELARGRLPQWRGRIWLGDAADWEHPQGMRFDYVHTLLDTVPRRRRGELVQHLLARVVKPGGRLLVSYYIRTSDHDRTAAEQLEDLGFEVSGSARPRQTNPPSPSITAWIDAP